MRATRAFLVAATGGGVLAVVGVLGLASADESAPAVRPADVKPENALVELGRRLFFDRAVTRAGMRSCADCHDPEHGYSDVAKQSADLRAVTAQHAQTLVDVADSKTFHWHGELASLEEVITPRLEDTPPASALQYYGGRGVEGVPPIETTLPAFVASTLDVKKLPAAAETMGNGARYREAFSAAFGTSAVTTHRVAHALEAYVRSIRSGASAYDRYAAGDERAMTPAAVRGLELFRGAAGCSGCHTIDAGPSSSGGTKPATRARFTDYALHEINGSGGPAVRTAVRSPDAPKGKQTPARERLGANPSIPSDVERRPGLTGAARPHKEAPEPATAPSPPSSITPSGPSRTAVSRAGIFKTPTLRDVARRGPFTHDGDCPTLAAAVRQFLPMPAAVATAPAAAPAPGAVVPAAAPPEPAFDDADVDDLVAFLQALTSDDRPGLAASAWRPRAASTRLRFVDDDGRPLSRLVVSLSVAGDPVPAERPSGWERDVLSRTTDEEGWLEFAMPPTTHVCVETHCGVEPVGGPLVPDTCRVATLRIPVLGTAKVIVMLPAAVAVPPSICVDHPDAQRFADREVPTTTLDLERSAPLAGGRVVAVYSGPLRTGLKVPARMLTTAGTRAGKGKPVALSPDIPAAVDLSR